MTHHRSSRPDGRRFNRTFTLRLWCEEGSVPGTLRGSIVEVDSGRRFFFSAFAELEGFLRSSVAEPEAAGNALETPRR